MLVADGKVQPFEGDLDDYKKWVKEYQARGGKSEARGEAGAGVNRRDERRAEAQERQRQSELRKPFEKRIASIEREMEPLTRESAEAEAWLSAAEAYQEGNRERLQEILKRRAELAARLAKLEEDWLWAQAELEKKLGTDP
jgi:ATP-binding cassette, subfamily F, member 3